MSELLARWEALAAGEREHRIGLPAGAGPVSALDPGGACPASTVQRAQWVLAQSDADGPSPYSVPFAVELSGPYDRAALLTALTGLVQDLPVLQSSFRLTGDGVVESLLAPDASGRVTVEQVSSEQLGERIGGLVHSPQPMTGAELFSAVLLVTDDGTDVLLLRGHHAVVDGLSMARFIELLADRYRRARTGRAPGGTPPAYRALVASIEARHRKAVEQGAGGWWRDHLAGAVPARVPPDTDGRVAVSATAGGHVERVVPEEHWAQVRAMARGLGLGDAAVVLALVAAVCSRHIGDSDLVLGLSTAGRATSSEMDCIGPFADTVPARVRVPLEGTFAELLESLVGTPASGVVAHPLPFPELVREVHAERRSGRNPLYDVLVTMDPVPSGDQVVDGSLTWRVRGVHNGTARVALQVTAAAGVDGLRLRFDYRRRDYTDAYIEQLAGEVVTAASQASGSDRALGTWHLGSGKSTVARPAGAALPVLDRFRRSVASHSDRVAVRGSRILSYADVDRLSDRLAAALATRTEPGDKVACRGDLSVLAPVTVLALFKAGLVYVPIAGDFPPARVDMMLQDAGVAVTLEHESVDGDLAVTIADARGGSPARVRLEEGSVPGAGADRTHPTAYVIFTSGSTGRPKGVQIGHRALATFVAAMAADGHVREGERVLAITRTTFDISLDEILLPLLVGGCVVVGPAAITAGAGQAVELIRTGQVDVVHGTPSVMHLLLAAGWPDAPSLQRVLVGGEALTAPLARQLARRAEQVVNLYGPTEATVWALAEPIAADGVGADRAPLIGRPLPGYSVVIADAAGEPLPPGMPGELCIGGNALADGYLGLPDLTADRFAATPGGTLYRTGDVARMRRDGRVEFLGRRDGQVKVRGHRIELEDIESTVRTLPGVVNCAAGVVGDAVGILVVGRWPSDARPRLAGVLPAPMIPAFHRVVPALPLTASGKLDRRRVADELTEPATGSTGGPAGPAEPLDDADLRVPAQEAGGGRLTDHERWVTAVWTELLGRPIGRFDNLFEAGGHSLLLARTAARARDERGLELSLEALFAAPTVCGVGQVMAAADAELREVLALVASLGDEEARRLLEDR